MTNDVVCSKRRGKDLSQGSPKLGEDHPDTLTNMANLASTYRDQGRWVDAEKLEIQVVEASKAKLGANHPDTLTSMTNLASMYREQGKYEDAERLDLQVKEAKKGIESKAC